MKDLILISAVASFVIGTKVNAQVSSLGNGSPLFPPAPFVGWNGTGIGGARNLDIKNNYAAQDINFFTNTSGINGSSTQVMTIKNTTGFVGIGTISPTQKLEVENGNINIFTNTNAFMLGSQNILWHKGEIRSIFVGVNAGASTTGVTAFQNTFVGHNAGTSNISGQRNTFVGASAGESIAAGNFNVFIGTEAGKMLMAGNHNTFVGEQCGDRQITGTNNSFFGAHTATGPAPSAGTGVGNNNTILGAFAGADITNGDGNTFSGVNAGSNCDNGSNNTFTGINSGNQCTTGSRNTMCGIVSGFFTSTGNDNVFVGNRAGIFNTTGSNNTYIGTNTGFATAGVGAIGNIATNATALGNGAQIRRSNVMILGNNLVNVGIGLSNDISAAQGPQNKLEIDAGINGFNPSPSGSAGTSGLRFRDLHSGNSTIPNPGTGVLSVNAQGDVIYVPDGGAGNSLGNLCSATNQNPLAGDYEIPLNLNNFYFSGNNATKERVAVGIACGTVLPSKFNVSLDKTFSTSFVVGNNAGYFRNINVGAAHNVGVKGEVTAGPGDNTGGYFISNSAVATAGNVGTRSIASNGTSAFGVLATSQNGSIWSVAGKFDVINSNSPQNYGINSNVFGSANPSSTNFGGLFYNSYTGSTNFGVQATAFNSTANYAIFGSVGGTNTSTTPNWAGYFNGDVFTSSIQYYASDKDLKKDIQVIKAPLEKIMKLKPSYFQYDTAKGNLYGMNLPEGYNYGFIAQEIETVFPELVINSLSAPVVDSSGITFTPQTPFKAVNYNGMIGIVTGAVQELNAKQQAMQTTLDKAGLSDAQVKTNVNTFNALATVKTLSPVKYNFTNANVQQLNFKPNTDYGFIAQQLETVYPELVDTIRIDATYDSLGVVVNPSKVLKTVNYKAMSALLVRSIQEQQFTIDSLRNVQSKQDSINQAVQQQLAALASQINSCCSYTSARNANSNINQLDIELSDKDAIVLNQNVPNPFAEQTTITYNVPASVEKAQLIFFNANGQVIQTVDIKTRGKGKVNVFASDLSSGLYHYTLVADGKVVDSKKMVRE